MFGQAPTTSPFGAPAPAPFGGGGFGAPAPAPFGSPAPAPGGFGAAPATGAFGAPAPAAGGFGAPSAFGQPAPAAPAFGAPATTGFGAAPAPSAFGAPAPATGGLFGSAAPAPAFGSPAPAPAFGAKPGGLFGSAPAPAGGLFGGAPAPAPGGLFGSAPSPAPFGAPAPATPFGAPAPAPSAFGAPAPSAFGAPAPGAFGAAPAAGGFGQPQQQQAGTTMAPYQATTKQDGTNSIILQAITAMPQYESKSFEELRLEDYMAGNKGTKGQAAPAPAGFGGFGAAPQPAPAFGQPAPAPAFGAPAPTTGGLFGSAPAPAPTGGLFGSPAPAPAFGQPAPAPAFGAAPAPAAGGLFGSAPAPAPTGGLFGAPTPAPAFGQPTPAPAFGAPAPATGGLFGSTPAPAFGAAPTPAPAFGAAPAPAGGLFGAPAPAAPAPGGLFGSTPAPTAGGLFGSTPAPAPGGLFGQPAPAPATGGLFGASPAKPGGLFGSTPAPAPGGLFGQPAPAPAMGGLFGQTQAPAAGGLFGSTPAPAVPAAPPPSAEAVLAQQLAAVENQKKQLELLEAWRGNPPSGSKVVPTSQYDTDSGNDWNGGGSSYAATSSALLSYRAAPRSAAKIRPRGYTPSKHSPVTSLAKKTGSPILSPNRFVGSATKTLFIKPNSLTPKPKTRLLLTNGISSGNGSPAAALENGGYESPNKAIVPTQQLTSPAPTNGSQPKPVDSASPQATGGSPSTPAQDFYRQVVDPTGASPPAPSPSPADKKFVPKLTKSGYVVYPPIADLEAMSEADLAAVSNFKVERPGYGSVAWDGAVDVRGVDIDTVVMIESKNVSVYDEAEESGEKPQQGSKLNRPAVITMHGIYPKDGAESSAEAKAKLKRKIEKSTKKMGAELLSFEEDIGVWKFRVGHFSRYGLDDDDESDDDSDDEVKATPSLATDDEHESLNPVEQMKELGGASKMHAPMDEDESTSAYTDNMSAIETIDDDEREEETHDLHAREEAIMAGEEAYAMMTEEVYEEEAIIPYENLEEEFEEEILLFPNEAQECTITAAKQPLRATIPASRPIPSSGISSRLAEKCGLKSSSSSIDFGMRMRRSFRVAWRPDGSFLKLAPSSSGGQVWVQSRPALAPKSDSTSTSLPLLQTHQKHSVNAAEDEDDAPIFTLPRSVSPGAQPLFSALEDYSRSSAMCSFTGETKQVVAKSFSLLTCLYGGDGTMDESRRLEAVSSWMKGVCSPDTLKAVSFAQSSGDVYGSVFAALSGGDVSTATSLALESGNPRLSLMLANTGVQAQPFCTNQLEKWNKGGAQPYAPTGILRIFSLASGSIDLERQMFKSGTSSYTIDWRRRFGMLLWSCSKSQEGATVSSIVKQYDEDISAMVAPPATPLYCNNPSEAANQCTLYQVLKQYADEDTLLASIVAPSSHSPFHHDFSASFHLVAAMTALSSSTLSPHQEDVVVDAVVSQLISEGLWEWAVYASLCFIGSGSVSKSAAFAKRLRAKSIVSRFYSASDPSADRRSSFLTSIGIPASWLQGAQAFRCASEGDIFGMVSNLLRTSVPDSMASMESLIIPHLLLEGKESMQKLWQLLEAVRIKVSDDSIDRWNKPNGCRVIHQYLELHAQVDKLCNMSLDEGESSDIDVDHLIALASELETEIFKGKGSAANSQLQPAKIPYGFTRTPWNVLLAEMAATLSLLRMKLMAVQNGQSVEETNGDSCSSHLAFALSPDGLFDSSTHVGNESILRGFCGYKA